MIEAAWLKEAEGGATEIWAKCASCHNDRMVATNVRDAPEGQPFCTCVSCGTILYQPNKREELIDLVVSHGWSRGVVWLMAQNIGEDDRG